MADDYYGEVNGAWPAGPLPAITREEARRAARRLARHFHLGASPVMRRGYVRRVWISSKPTTRRDKGWHRLVHDVSHIIFARENPNAKDHGGYHAKYEKAMIEYAIARGWLDGRLKTKAPAKLAPDVRLQKKLDHARAMLAAKEREIKRATTLAKKWRRRARHYERKLGGGQVTAA